MGFLSDCRLDLAAISKSGDIGGSFSEITKGDNAVETNRKKFEEDMKETAKASKLKKPNMVSSFVKGVVKGAKDRADIKRGYDPNKAVAQARVLQDVMKDDDGYGY